MAIVVINFLLSIPVAGGAQDTAVKPQLKIPAGHAKKINAIAISPDSKYIATGSDDNSVILWDAKTGADLTSVTFPRSVKDVVFSPDGTALSVGVDEKKGGMRGIYFYTMHLRSGFKPDKLMFLGNSDALFSSDERYLDTNNFHTSIPHFSPDGRFYVLRGDETIHDGNIVLLYSANGKLIRKMQQHANQVLSYCFSNDGRYVHTDHNYFPLSEQQRRQDYEDMQKIIAKLRVPFDTKSAHAMKHHRDSIFDEINLQIIKQYKEKEGKRNTRVWDLSLGKITNVPPDGVGFTKDSTSPDKKYLVTSIVKKTYWSDLTAGRTDTANSTRQPRDPQAELTMGEKISDFINDEVERETKNTPINLDSEFKDQNSEINRVFSQEALLVKKGSKDTISLISIDSTDWVIVNREGYYMCSKNSARLLRYEMNNKIYYFDQFDLQYNRPDKVLESIGIAPKNTLEVYRKAYENRVRQMGFDPHSFEKETTWNVPEIEISGVRSVYDSSASRAFSFKVMAKDKKYAIKTINVLVNGVPEKGMQGYYVGDLDLTDVEKDVKVELSIGKNIIEVYVVNKNGAASFTERFEVEYTGPPERTE